MPGTREQEDTGPALPEELDPDRPASSTARTRLFSAALRPWLSVSKSSRDRVMQGDFYAQSHLAKGGPQAGREELARRLACVRAGGMGWGRVLPRLRGWQFSPSKGQCPALPSRRVGFAQSRQVLEEAGLRVLSCRAE